MYEPYPYPTSKVKIASLFILVILLFSGLIYFRWFNPLIRVEVTVFSQIQDWAILLKLLLLFLCIKTFFLKYSRDYIYIGCSLLIILLFLAMDRFSHLIMSYQSLNLVSFAKLKMELLFLSIFLLLAAYNGGKSVPFKRRKFVVLMMIVAGLSIPILISFLIAYYCIEFYRIDHLHRSVMILTLLITLWTAYKFFTMYDKKGFNIYFWYTVSCLFLISSSTFQLASRSEVDVFSFIFQLCLIGVFTGLIVVTFEEHSRLMESEIDMRNSLEKSLVLAEKNFNNYQNIIDHIAVGVVVIDEDGLITFSNDRFGKLVGIPKEQLVGHEQTLLFDESNLDKFLIEKEKWITGISSQFEIEIKSKNNKKLPLLISSTPIRDRFAQYKGSRHVAIEISGWKEFERQIKEYSTDLELEVQKRTQDLHERSEELKQAKTYYETLISGMMDILLVIDPHGNCIFINDYGKKILGYDIDALTKSYLPDFLTDMENIQKNYGKSMKIELRDYETELKTKDDRHILCSWNVRYLFNPDGTKIGAMCVGRDISEYKSLQRKLEEQSKNLEQLVEKRTAELNVKINQLASILKVGEDIILNIDVNKILANICNAIHQLGWNITIVMLKETTEKVSRIAAYSGISKTKITKFIEQREDLFKNTLSYIHDEYRIGHSYYVEADDSNFITRGIKKVIKGNHVWKDSSVLISPIKLKNRILGFMMVFSPDDGLIPTEEKTQIVEIFAQKAAVAIENTHLFQQLESRADELEDANRIKSQFFANMSHELRTPLNSIITLTGVLLKKITGDLNSEQIRQLKIIQKNGERLLSLINDILDISKIDAGKMETNFTYFPIEKVIESTIGTIRPLCDKKRLKLEVDIEKNVPPYIFSDRNKFDLVLTNILSNAVKFTDNGKISVAVKTSKNGTLLDIFVKDTGIGIDKNELEKIFQPFHQSAVDTIHQNKGTGLGLSLSKELWQMLGGSIFVTSKPGKGSQFHLQLPLKELTDEEQFQQRDASVEDANISKIADTKNSESRKQAHILLVDDNLDNQYALKFILEDKGYRVSFANNGDEGYKKAVKENPTLILMDMMMPGIDGYEATRRIRMKKEFKQVPIIAMTAKTEKEDSGKAIAAGCSDYLSKPFSLTDVVDKVEKWIGNKK